MFKKYFAPQWELQNPETVIAPYEDCGVKSVAKRPLNKFYPSNERDDLELFEQCLAARKDFCSNVDAVKIFEDGKYEIITAAQSIINRIKEEAQKKTQTQPSSNHAQATERPFQAQRTQSRQAHHTTESKGFLPIIVAIIVVILVLIFLVLS